MLALCWSSVHKTLYTKALGSGAWSEFATQPPVSGGYGGLAMAGLPDGSIVVYDAIADQMHHWNPATSAWVSKAAPGGGIDWLCIAAIGTNDAVAWSTRNVATYDGDTGTWTHLGEIDPDAVISQVHGVSLTDLWIATIGGDARLWHYTGAAYPPTNLLSAVITALGFNPGAPSGVWVAGASEVYILFGGSPNYLVLWNGATYSDIGVLAEPDFHLTVTLPSRFLVGQDNSKIFGYGNAGGVLRVWRCNNSGGTPVFSVQTGSASDAVQDRPPVFTPDGTHVYSLGASSPPTVYESTDSGATFAATTGLPTDDSYLTLGGLWIVDDVDPLIENESPPDGSRWNAPRSWASFDATDTDSGIDVAATVIKINGVVAWENDAPASGFEGWRSTIADGYAYQVRQVTWTATPKTIEASVADIAGNTATSTWTYTEWGGDDGWAGGIGGGGGGGGGGSVTFGRILDALLPPGAFDRGGTPIEDNLVRVLTRGAATAVGGHGQVLLDQLADEVFPQLAVELLPEWEALLEIVPPAAATDDERREALLTKWRGGVSLSVGDLRAALAPVLDQLEADVDIREADPTVASGTCGVFTAFVFRDPTLPGRDGAAASYNISEAQRAADRLKSAHVRILVGESDEFLTNDPYSLTNRDLLGS